MVKTQFWLKILLLVFLVVFIPACSSTAEPAQPISPRETEDAGIPYYFIAIHNEPYNFPGGVEQIDKDYSVLKSMIEKANKYNIKLTLMFTAQWADYISESSERLDDLESWKQQGHEIAAHHHSIYHGNWDGYTDYSREEAIKQRAKGKKK